MSLGIKSTLRTSLDTKAPTLSTNTAITSYRQRMIRALHHKTLKHLNLKEAQIYTILVFDESILTFDLLSSDWKKHNELSGIRVLGHCYAASEAMYYLTGGKSIWTPCNIKYDNGSTHWWLRRKSDGLIVDPTLDQFILQGKNPDYEMGKGRGFMPQSDRSKVIIDRIMCKLCL